MRTMLDKLAADPSCAVEANEVRRELVIQEIAVEQLKHNLRTLYVAASGSS